MYAADNRPNQYDTRPQQMHSTKKKKNPSYNFPLLKSKNELINK